MRFAVRIFLGVVTLVAIMAQGLARAAEATYPAKPVRVVVPFAPGGATDVIARILSERLSERMAQRFVVDNRAGGAAIPGTDIVARSDADGYTLLLTANPHTVNQALGQKLPYDPIADFAPVTLAGLQPLFLVLHQDVPAKTLQELVAELKANPTRYYYATSGTGGPQHLAGEMFKQMTKTSITHVPMKGAAPAATELLSGRVQIAFGGATNVLPHVQASRLKAIATTGAQRSRLAPTLPTLDELGLSGFDSVAWLGLLAPRGTPTAIVNRVAEEAARALAEEGTREKLFAQGIEAVGNRPGEFAQFLRDDLARFTRVVREGNIKPD